MTFRAQLNSNVINAMLDRMDDDEESVPIVPVAPEDLSALTRTCTATATTNQSKGKKVTLEEYQQAMTVVQQYREEKSANKSSPLCIAL